MFDVEAAQENRQKLLDIATQAESIKMQIKDTPLDKKTVSIYNSAQQIVDKVSPLLTLSLESKPSNSSEFR